MDVTDLIRLVEANDLEQLRSVLENGTDPNLACQYTGMTALLSACETNNFAAVQILIDAGADPNWRHFDGYNCYDSTQNPAIKHFVIEHGFNLILSRTSQGKRKKNIEKSCYVARAAARTVSI
jgi:ankyrin repeat protein